ncbi:diacylglycerol kinase family protein [Hoeflea sp. YIM 152468]|uniref:diacylglycerol/lipid kinase family protein n=1 Tax=Hoeflea sp. YIM 152468 TaxID=3031759 RepID=UPI0023DA6E6B|nr:diacylglycerol kinase family protein [Hoeflea sp. YIM 152468]MDF1609654.1 diacylglycerol kinase family protein [Hoeflea sp. YIM 152468]
MRITLILNQDGGTIRGMDAREFGDMAAARLARPDGDCTVKLVSGSDLIQTLEQAGADDRTDIIVAGGGDGTISAAAGICFKSGKVLGVLPLGTMNLFARSLGLPLDPAEALDALATAQERPLDIATANGRPYVHQYSVGLHARLVQQREHLDTSTRLRKITSTVKSLAQVIMRPPRFGIDIDTGSGRRRQIVSAVAISNNLFGDTPLAYAPLLDEGVLGVYRSRALGSGTVLRMTLRAAIGKLKEDPDMSVEAARKVVLKFSSSRAGTRAAIDGEMIPLEREVECICHPGALRALVPKTYAGLTEPEPLP